MGLHSRGIHVITTDDAISWATVVILRKQARLVDGHFTLDYEGFGLTLVHIWFWILMVWWLVDGT